MRQFSTIALRMPKRVLFLVLGLSLLVSGMAPVFYTSTVQAADDDYIMVQKPGAVGFGKLDPGTGSFTSLHGGPNIYTGTWSLDGRYFAFRQWTGSNFQTGVYDTESDSVGPYYAPGDQEGWLPGNRVVYRISPGQFGTMDVTTGNLSGHSYNTAMYSTHHTYSHDGTKLAWVEIDGEHDPTLRVRDLTTEITTTVGPAIGTQRVDWSADDSKIVFDSIESHYEVFTASANGSGFTKHTADISNDTGNPTISPDGNFIVYTSYDEDSQSLAVWKRNVATHSTVRLITGSYLDPHWRPVIPDNDSDGVPNNVDQCPNEAGPVSNNGCPESQKRVFEIKLMTFIPSNYIDSSLISRRIPIELPFTHPQAMCQITGGDNSTILIGAGDDRGYNATAAENANKPYRSLQKIRVQAETKDGKTTFSILSNISDMGKSESFVKFMVGGGGALNHGTPNRIDASDRDSVLGDCFLKHAERQGTGTLPAPALSKVSDTRGRLRLTGEVRNGLIPLSPSIQWNTSLDIEMNAGSTPRIFVNGSHDLFPAYEMYVNNQPVYRFAPDGLQAGQLPVPNFGAGDIAGLYVNTPLTPTTTVLSE